MIMLAFVFVSIFHMGEKTHDPYGHWHPYHNFLIHSNNSHSLAIVNNGTIDIDVQISLLYPDLHFFGYTTRSGITGSYDSSIFSFFEKA
jgi:hypothetical protein